MTVYFAQSRADASRVKIGFTGDIAKRIGNLSVGVPGGLAVICSISGGKETEEYLHEKFEQYRVGGEWFQYSDEIREFIIDMQNGKQGLIPFHDHAQYMTRTEATVFSKDALAAARQMASVLLNGEFRGAGDTVDAAMFRLQEKSGLPCSLMARLRYRKIKDIWAGEYLQIKSVYEDFQHSSLKKSGTSPERSAR